MRVAVAGARHRMTSARDHLGAWLGGMRPCVIGMLAGVLVAALCAMAATLLLKVDRADELERAQRDLAAASLAAADLVERGLGTLSLMVSLAAEEFARGERDLRGVFEWLRSQAHRTDQLAALDRLVILDAAGTVQLSRLASAVGRDVSDRDYFRHHRDGAGTGMYVGQRITSRVRPGETIVPLSWALRDGKGQFVGVLAVVGNWQSFVEGFDDLAGRPEQTVALANAAGQVLVVDATHWPSSAEMPPRPPFLAGSLAAARAGQERIAVAGHVVASATLPSLGLTILAGEPLASILRPWTHRVQVAAALVIAIGLGAGWLTSQLHHRMQSLRAAVTAARVAQARAEVGERAKAQFLAAMSHEIRTPMTGVLGMADLLATEPLAAHQRAYVRAIQTSGKHLLSVINDVLDFSRLGAGSLTLEQIDFELADTLEQVRSIMTPLAVERGLELTIETAGDLPPTLFGDPTRLRQILVNLIANGLKFTPRGGVSVSVGRTGSASGGITVRFEVRDSGIGIPGDRLAALFQPFMQLDASTARQFGGSGLGLAICHELVKLQNGRIGVESEPGRGSLFWFELPFAIGRARSPAEVATSDPSAAPSRRILVAEDVAVNRDLLRASLTQAGHEVVLVANGAEAVELAARARFDVVLMDVQMPVMDGIEATRQIRALPAPPGAVPIVALTANVMDEERQRCLNAGMDRVLGKPIVWTELFAALSSLEPPTEPKPPSPVTDGPLLNREVIEGTASQLPPEVFKRLLQHGLQDVEESCGRLRAARGEPDRLRHEAHRLRGTAGSFGLARLSVLAGRIEDGGTGDVDGLVAELETTTAATRTALVELLRAQ